MAKMERLAHAIVGFSILTLSGCATDSGLTAFRFQLDNQRDRQVAEKQCLGYLTSWIGAPVDRFTCGSSSIDQWSIEPVTSSRGQHEFFVELKTGRSACLTQPPIVGDLSPSDFQTAPPALRTCVASPQQTWNFLQSVEVFTTVADGAGTIEYHCLSAPAAMQGAGPFYPTVSPCNKRAVNQLWAYDPLHKRISLAGLYFLATEPSSEQLVLKPTALGAIGWAYQDDAQLRGPGGRVLGFGVDNRLILTSPSEQRREWYFRGHIRNGFGNYLIGENRAPQSVRLRSGALEPRANHGWPPKPELPDEALFTIKPILQR